MLEENDYRRVREASNPETPAERLLALAQDKVPAVRASVMCNTSTASPDTVAQAIATHELTSTHSDWVLRQAIGASTRVSPDQHRAVAAQREWHVCIQLVNNPKCPEDLYTALAQEPEEGQVDLEQVHAIAKKRLDGTYKP